jgi:hypothetical protein
VWVYNWKIWGENTQLSMYNQSAMGFLVSVNSWATFSWLVAPGVHTWVPFPAPLWNVRSRLTTESRHWVSKTWNNDCSGRCRQPPGSMFCGHSCPWGSIMVLTSPRKDRRDRCPSPKARLFLALGHPPSSFPMGSLMTLLNNATLMSFLNNCSHIHRLQ